jgi:hypothetical protein
VGESREGEGGGPWVLAIVDANTAATNHRTLKHLTSLRGGEEDDEGER